MLLSTHSFPGALIEFDLIAKSLVLSVLERSVAEF